MPVLFYSRDPGGTNALIALCMRLESGGSEALLEPWAGPNRVILAKQPGLAAWHAAGLAAADLDDFPDGLARLDLAGFGSVATATSDIDDDTDILLWRMARSAGLRSLAVLDSTANLDVRFRARDGEWALPDIILCTDHEMANSVRASLDLAAGRCHSIGFLHLERVRQEAAGYSMADIAAVRLKWGCKPGQRVALFCSECGEEMRLEGRDPPYDEHEMLDRFLVEAASVEHGGPYDLVVVRPHPRDRVGKYDRHRKDRRTPWLAERQTPAVLAMLAADGVVGMGTAMLREASALGRPSHSLTNAAPTEATRRERRAGPQC